MEFKANHEEWLNATKPKLGPGLSQRVAEALSATDENVDSYIALRTELQSALTSLLEVSLLLGLAIQSFLVS